MARASEFLPKTPTGAIISDCGKFRYLLWRKWSSGPFVAWFMLNPSTANEIDNDRTVTMCTTLSRNWDYGGLVIANLFPNRTPYPDELRVVDEQNFRKNLRWIQRAGEISSERIVAWGRIPRHLQQQAVRASRLIETPTFCLGTTKSGFPRHPSRIRLDTELTLYDSSE